MDGKRPLPELIKSDPLVFEQVENKLRSQHRDLAEKLEAAAPDVESGFASIFDRRVRRESLDAAVARPGRGDQLDGLVRDDRHRLDRDQLEAIVEVEGRPSLIIKNEVCEESSIPELDRRLNEARVVLQSSIRAVGRVEIISGNHASPFGTGWLIRPDLIVTNRHVAIDFINADSLALTLNPGELLAVDLKREHSNMEICRLRVRKVRHIEPESSPHDVAFLEIERPDFALPDPMPLAASDAAKGDDVAAIGYPTIDHASSDPLVFQRYFGNILGVKRLSPGKVVSSEEATKLEHDCTTLGGSSGSAIVSLVSGQVVGLHFQGEYRIRNYAVKSTDVMRILRNI